MPELRSLLVNEGFTDVSTYVQSGNVVLTSDLSEPEVAERCEAAIQRELGLKIDVVVRDRAALAAVVGGDPFAAVATNPKRYLVLFFREALPDGLEARLSAAVVDGEAFAIAGREVYLWLPESVQRSRLWTMAAGVPATARNWNIVLALHDLLGQ